MAIAPLFPSGPDQQILDFLYRRYPPEPERLPRSASKTPISPKTSRTKRSEGPPSAATSPTSSSGVPTCTRS